MKIGLHVGYYAATLGYPLLETYKAMGNATANAQWVKVLSYWIIYTMLTLVSSLLFFVSKYIIDYL